MLRPTTVLNFIYFLAFIHEISLAAAIKQTWNFEFVSAFANSSDENLLEISVRLERIKRGVYGLSGTIDVKVDIHPEDDVMINSVVYRSATGTSEYKRTPFAIRKQHIFDFYNTLYKEFLMSSFQNCSNLPQFEDEIETPLLKNTYNLKSCVISNEKMPPYIMEGYYKIDTIGSGKCDWLLEIVVKVENI